MSKLVTLFIYLISFAVSTYLIYIYNKKDRKNKSLIIIAAILPIIILGLRKGIGTDYYNYYDIFNRINSGEYSLFYMLSNYDIFHTLLCKFIGIFGKLPQLVFMIYAIMTIYYIIIGIYQQSKDEQITYAFIIYICSFYGQTFNAIREGLAIALIMYLYKYIKEYNFKKVVTYLIFAICVHKLAIALIPFIFIWFLSKKKKVLNQKRNIIIIATYLFIVIFAYICVLLDIDFSNTIFSKVDKYFFVENFRIGLGVLALNIPFVLLTLKYRKYIILYDDNDMYILLYYVSIILKYLGYINYYLGRFSNCFNISLIFILSILTNVFEDKKKNTYMRVGLVVCCIGYFIYYYYFNRNSEIFPYRSILL